MEITETKVPPAPPNIITAIRGGFDAIANRIYIILIPVLLDLLLWLGPHFQIKGLVAVFMESLRTTPGFDPSRSDSLLPINPEVLQAAIERINLMTILRSYPIGIPSLVSGILPLEAPFGSPTFVDVESPVMVTLIWLVLTLLGILAGTLYFILIAQAALDRRLLWKKALKEWPRRLLQVIFLSVTVGVILVVLLIPSTCILSFVSMGGIPVSQIAVVVLVGMLLWVLFPLAFTPHGIIVQRFNIMAAIQRSIVLTRMTMPTTALFFLVILLAGQGLDILWRVPEENSWLTIVGLAGHAFVASALLASSFVYYRDADIWVQNIIRKMRMSNSA